jgi:hypothetical protein
LSRTSETLPMPVSLSVHDQADSSMVLSLPSISNDGMSLPVDNCFEISKFQILFGSVMNSTNLSSHNLETLQFSNIESEDEESTATI